MSKPGQIARRQKRKAGQVVKIALGDEGYGLGLVLREPLIAFLSSKWENAKDEEWRTGDLKVAFTLMVMNHAVTSGRWPVIDVVSVPEELKQPPAFCKRDSISGAESIYHEIAELAPNYERPAKPGECASLEAAAVWEPEHVEDRLRDYFLGISNKWVEQLK